MKRVIVDYQNISKELLLMLSQKYPDGYEDADIIQFKNSKGENIKAIEVRTEDTIYLVKVSVKLQETLEEMDPEDDDFGSDDDFPDTDDLPSDDDDSDVDD